MKITLDVKTFAERQHLITNEKYNCFKKQERHERIIMAPGKEETAQKSGEKAGGCIC